MRTRILSLSLLLSLFAGLSLTGCNTEADPQGDVDQSSAALTGDITDVVLVEAALAEVFDPGEAELPGAASEAVTQSLQEMFDECFTVEESGLSYVFTFDNCDSGGFLTLHGVITATWTPALRMQTYTIVTEGLEVSGATVSLDATVVKTPGELEGESQYDVDSATSFTGPRGNDSESTAMYTIVSGAGCQEVDGEWTSSGRRNPWTMSVDGFRHCGGCPESGVVARGNISLTFDGDATATWMIGERSGELALFCE